MQHDLRDAFQTLGQYKHKKIDALRDVRYHLCDVPQIVPRYKRSLLKLLLVTLQNVPSQLTERNYGCVARSWKYLHANVASDG